MFKRSVVILVVLVTLSWIAACTQTTPPPVIVVKTVVIKETVPIEKEIRLIITKEVEKEVERVVTVEVEKPVVFVETVEVVRLVIKEVAVTPAPATPTPTSTVDLTHPKVYEVLHQITMVQHHHDVETGVDTFSCASRGRGLNGVEIDPNGPRFVGPNSMDFDLWGIVALFKVCPDGQIFLVPQQTGGRFVDPEGIEHQSFTLAEALDFFASGDARWIGAHGEAGRIGECDPQYVTSTPTPD